jgi:hypothetical protein
MPAAVTAEMAATMKMSAAMAAAVTTSTMAPAAMTTAATFRSGIARG